MSRRVKIPFWLYRHLGRARVSPLRWVLYRTILGPGLYTDGNGYYVYLKG